MNSSGRPMLRLASAQNLREQVRAWRIAGDRIALVPTMGNLHDGHIQLVRRAQELAQRVVCSIFVNPTQFGPNEDFSRYPRSFDADCLALEAQGCDAVFAPDVNTMYPEGTSLRTRIAVDGLRDQLCGAFRPGHFDGVATVVAKLFNLCQPDVALFGEKDYQQLTVIRTMVRDLDLPVEIVGVATVREANGLAMSSRNQYLDPQERMAAGQIHAQLQALKQDVQSGCSVTLALQHARASLENAGFRLDYLELRDAHSLQPLSEDRGTAGQQLVALVALHWGRARLIDNLRFSLS